jgi:hypothetical protein
MSPRRIKRGRLYFNNAINIAKNMSDDLYNDDDMDMEEEEDVDMDNDMDMDEDEE